MITRKKADDLTIARPVAHHSWTSIDVRLTSLAR